MAERALHVAVDGRELLGKPTGVGRYLSEILRVWAQTPNGPRVTVLVPEAPSPAVIGIGASLEWHVAESTSRGTRWEQTRLPRALATVRPDVFLAPGNTAPLLTRYPMAVIIYDVSFFARPEWFSARDGLRRRVLTKASARRAQAVVTISEFSRSEIARYLGVDGARVTIAPPGAPPLRPDDGRKRPPVVLYAGSLFNRRHPEDMLAAFRLVRERLPESRLILAGDNRTRPHVDPLAIAAALGIADAVEWRAYVDDDTLARLYDEAGAFLFLSDYEGFGITPLEALAHHVPPVVLDLPISREVYGDGAVRVAAEPRAIADALVRLLTNPDECARVLVAGRTRLAHYQWPTTAATVLDVLRRIAA